MASKTSNTESAEDLFDAPEDDFDDLLDSIEEDDSEGWNPQERGEFIVGEVVKVGQTRSDYAKDGEDPMVPCITIRTKTGDKFRVIGYGSVLRKEIIDQDPRQGDSMAVKYWGEKILKKGRFAGKPYRHFSVAVRHRES